MTIVSLTDCCRLLAIDPKTLHRWLSLSHLSAQSHPLDARLKCVTREQVQQLAVTHRRILPESSEQHFQPETSPPSTPSDVIRASVLSSVVSDVSVHITALTQQLGSLQAHVATLQHQLSLPHRTIAKGAAMANKPRDFKTFNGQVSRSLPWTSPRNLPWTSLRSLPRISLWNLPCTSLWSLPWTRSPLSALSIH